MNRKIFLALFVFACFLIVTPESKATSLQSGPCLSTEKRLLTDGYARQFAKTRTQISDRYAEITSTPENKCIHFVESRGAGDRPLIVLLHGVPETWYAWRKLIDPFAEAGYDLLIPDLPGMGQSSRPNSVDALSLPALANDISELIRLSGRQKAVVVGHDIGGTVAWAVAMYAPHVVDRLVIVSAPHPGIWREALVDVPNPEQIKKSAYAYDFAYHGEFFASLTNQINRISAKLNLIVQAFYNPRKGFPKNSGAITFADIAMYAGELNRDNAPLWITRYYTQLLVKTMKVREVQVGGLSDLPFLNPLKTRYEKKHGITPVDAEIGISTPRPIFPSVPMPTLLFFDRNDPYNSDIYVDRRQLQEAGVTDFRIVRTSHSSHWIPEDVPNELFEAIKRFLNEPNL